MAALADTQAIALATGRKPATIRSWAMRYRDELPRRGTGKHGRALYDVGDAEKLAARIDAELAAWAAAVETPVTMCHTDRAGGSLP